MKITVRWTIAAMNRREGDTETVEYTDFMAKLVGQGRVVVLEWHPDPVVEAPLDAPKPEPVPTAEEVMVETTVKPPLKPRPRPPIKIQPVKD